MRLRTYLPIASYMNDATMQKPSPNSMTPSLCLPQVPGLGGALEADTVEILQDVAKHDMSEAIEHVVCGLKEVEDDLMQAFLTRDKGRTGSLGSSDFKVSRKRFRSTLDERRIPQGAFQQQATARNL